MEVLYSEELFSIQFFDFLHDTVRYRFGEEFRMLHSGFDNFEDPDICAFDFYYGEVYYFKSNDFQLYISIAAQPGQTA